jgi:8-oxo-dGTP diphosphatase
VFDVVIVYLLKGQHPERVVLLGDKGRGLGVGRLVGPGGKVMRGETPQEAAAREVFEEVAVTVHPDDLEHGGTITYPFPTRPEHSQRSFVFTATQFHGVPQESDELSPAWYPVLEIPWERMWDDASRWLPRVLDGGFVEATFTIGDDDCVIDEVWTSA